MTAQSDMVLLFTYGLLQPDHQPPASVAKSWPDHIRAELYDLGEYPGAIKIGQVETWIAGHVLEVARSELPALDQFEETHTGEYARIKTTTRLGHVVEVYEYRWAIPDGATALAAWRLR